MVRRWTILATLSFAILSAAPAARADPALNDRIERIAGEGIEFLKTRGQADDGSFSGESGVAVTALCVRAVLEHRPNAVNEPWIREALNYVESRIQSDGGIYTPGSRHKNYETSIAVMALLEANRDGRYDSVLGRGEAFLKDLQWDEDRGAGPSDPRYGGAGYGSSGTRPDLSNTSFLIEALRGLGNDADDESIQKALKFVTRTQNLSGQGNDTEHAGKIGDGGFYYTPAAGGQTKAGTTANGGLRSYGSMTYTGLKSMIYAGLTKDDPRVEAAMDFIRNHYTLENNPNMGAQGLYYYYHTFAKALGVAGVETLDDAEGEAHPWRQELVDKLEETQQKDGSWVNDRSGRWMEGDRNLVTAYALLALAFGKESA